MVSGTWRDMGVVRAGRSRKGRAAQEEQVKSNGEEGMGAANGRKSIQWHNRANSKGHKEKDVSETKGTQEKNGVRNKGHTRKMVANTKGTTREKQCQTR